MLLSARCNAIADAATELSLLATAWTRRLTARQDPKHEIPQDVILALVSHAQDALDQIDRILIAQGMATDEVDGGA